jgi:autotransporter translocation and assembly factor TamB
VLKLLRIAVAGAILLAGFFLAVALFSRTPPGRRLIRATIERVLASELGGTVRIGRVRGGLVRDLTLDDVRVIVDGRTVARVARIEIVHDLQSILRRRFDVVRLTAIRPWVRLVHDVEGWRVPVPEPEEHERGSGLDVYVRHVEVVEGRLALALLDTTPPRRLAATRIGAEGAVDVVDDVVTLRVGQARFTPRGAAVTPATADGTLVLDGDTFRSDGIHVATERSRVNASGSVTIGRHVDARLSLEPLAAGELAAIVGSREVTSDVRGLAAVSGPWNAIAFTAGARFEPGGRASATGHVDLTAEPFRHDFRLRFAELDPGAAVPRLPRGQLFGHVEAAGTGVRLEGPWNARVALDSSDLEGRKIDSFRWPPRAARDAGAAARGPSSPRAPGWRASRCGTATRPRTARRPTSRSRSSRRSRRTIPARPPSASRSPGAASIPRRARRRCRPSSRRRWSAASRSIAARLPPAWWASASR